MPSKNEEGVISNTRLHTIPDNWTWMNLSEFAECLDSCRKPINSSERANRMGTIPYYGATGQVGWIDDYLTDEHLVLVGEDGAPFFDFLKDKAYIISGKAWVNNHAHILRSRFGVTGNIYLMHYLNIFNYNEYANGTTRLKLTQGSLNRIPIPVPPLPEQQRIVDRIENLFEKLDQAKELAQKVLDQFEERKAAILHKAFTGELTREWRNQNKKPDDWEKISLDKIMKFFGGGTPSKSNSNYWNGNINWASVKDIKGDYLLRTLDTITEEGLTNSSSYLAQAGDLLLITRIDPGKTIITKIPVAINQDLKVIKTSQNIKFMHYYFMLLKKEIVSKSSGSTVLGIRLEILNKIIINLPSLDEQEEITQILDEIFDKETQSSTLIDVIEKINLMKKSILVRAFRGELGTNSPEEK